MRCGFVVALKVVGFFYLFVFVILMNKLSEAGTTVHTYSSCYNICENWNLHSTTLHLDVNGYKIFVMCCSLSNALGAKSESIH